MALKDADFVRKHFSFKTKARVYEAARLGLIPSVRIGRQVRFDEDSLQDWIKKGGSAIPESRTNSKGSK